MLFCLKLLYCQLPVGNLSASSYSLAPSVITAITLGSGAPGEKSAVGPVESGGVRRMGQGKMEKKNFVFL